MPTMSAQGIQSNFTNRKKFVDSYCQKDTEGGGLSIAAGTLTTVMGNGERETSGGGYVAGIQFLKDYKNAMEIVGTTYITFKEQFSRLDESNISSMFERVFEGKDIDSINLLREFVNWQTINLIQTKMKRELEKYEFSGKDIEVLLEETKFFRNYITFEDIIYRKSKLGEKGHIVHLGSTSEQTRIKNIYANKLNIFIKNIKQNRKNTKVDKRIILERDDLNYLELFANNDDRKAFQDWIITQNNRTNQHYTQEKIDKLNKNA